MTIQQYSPSISLFDEIAYLEMYPDVAAAVAAGSIASGAQHYTAFGRAEGRRIRSRTRRDRGHILITGTGRAGTTLLVQILTTLGFDTGFTPEKAASGVDDISQAGLEHLLWSGSPLVVKSPWLAETLLQDLGDGRFKAAFAIVPIRELADAAESRRRVHFAALEQGRDTKEQPGALWKTDQPALQEEKLAQAFFQVVYALVSHEIPTLFLKFPNFARDTSYAFKRLEPMLSAYGVSFQEFDRACGSVIDLDKIHF